MTLRVTTDALALREAFTISRGSRTHAEVLRVEITRDGITGQGECVPYARYGETMHSVRAAIEGVSDSVHRADLSDLLPAGAARNAIDCALWDWRAKAEGKPVWKLAGLSEPGPVLTAYTLSLAAPEAMRDQAARNAERPLLKVKLGGGPEDTDRIAAVRDGAPDARIIVDANEGWTAGEYKTLAPVFVELGVEMVEQPFPAGDDAALADLERVLPVCADESCHDRASLEGLHAGLVAGDGAGAAGGAGRRGGRPRRAAAAGRGPRPAAGIRERHDPPGRSGAVGMKRTGEGA